MKNAEKYARHIAEVLANSESCIAASVRPHDRTVCIGCTFEGICTDEDKLEEWLLREDV